MKYTKMFRKALVKQTNELLKDGQDLTFAGYCAATDLLKDLYFAISGIKDGDYSDDVLHDWACDVVNQIKRGLR